ncbi:MAG: VWA domain-containing protein [Bacteroidetes bacterium]|nr:MAG: VWA domain-containing protein [Bacteroidota bacterium]
MSSLRFLPLLGLLLLFASCDPYAGAYRDPDLSPTAALSGERYTDYGENPFVLTADSAVSTFSVDADGASYANVRRMLREGYTPPAAAVRIEEFLNYFPLDYPDPAGPHPIGLHGEISPCPWAPDHKLVRLGIQGRRQTRAQLPGTNWVFLIDVSGSMGADDKLPLLQEALLRFVPTLRPDDYLSIVTYAGRTEVSLPATPASETSQITRAIRRLKARGSTAGEAGILLAYDQAEAHLIPDGNNRILLCTDGDFNVGLSDTDQLVSLIEEKRETGIFLTVIGLGTGNLNDAMLEEISNHGNGTFEYIDSPEQADKVFLHEFGKFYPVAQDVKVQVAFNPDLVQAWRLIGYENRVLDQQAFQDDSTDAGDIGTGQNITALYELQPVPDVDYKSALTLAFDLRYKLPGASSSQPLRLELTDPDLDFASASADQHFLAGLAGFGLLLRQSEHAGSLDFVQVRELVEAGRSYDPQGYRQELLDLVDLAE